MRDLFKDDPGSMNLINIYLRAMDSGHPKAEEHNAAHLKFYQNELAHSKKLFCEHCGNPMEVYYDVHCFRCEKPEVKDCVVNFIMVRNWLTRNEPLFDADEFWDALCEREYLKGNDSYMTLSNSDDDDSYGKNSHNR